MCICIEEECSKQTIKGKLGESHALSTLICCWHYIHIHVNAACTRSISHTHRHTRAKCNCITAYKTIFPHIVGGGGVPRALSDSAAVNHSQISWTYIRGYNFFFPFNIIDTVSLTIVFCRNKEPDTPNKRQVWGKLHFNRKKPLGGPSSRGGRKTGQTHTS